MRYFKITGGNGYCGCDWEEYIAFTEEDLLKNEFCVETAADNFAFDYAETYEDVVDEEDLDDYYDRISDYTYWEEITEEEYKANT